MLPQIVEIATPGHRLRLERGFLKIASDEGDIGSLPVADIAALIASTPAVSITGQALAALAERGTPIVFCGGRFSPTAYVLPATGHHAQGGRVEAQAAATQPVKKRLWADIVRAKIRAQAEALCRVGVSDVRLRRLISEVRSGDPKNVEASAAQAYWTLMMGRDFRRNRDASGTNTLLNYGYTVLRAAAARSIVGAGLHPSLGLHHKSRGDGLRLADDLMEPFRPIVDLVTREHVLNGEAELTPAVKRRLAAVLTFEFSTDVGTSPLSTVMVRLAGSIARVFLKEQRSLTWPKPMLPLEDALEARGSDGDADGEL